MGSCRKSAVLIKVIGSHTLPQANGQHYATLTVLTSNHLKDIQLQLGVKNE